MSFIEKEWLVDDVTSVGSSDRVECYILGMVLNVFWPFQAVIVVGEPFCDLGFPS